MFQLYKKRGFSEFVGDTFDFLKIEGKSYFKNYFIINGIVLLLLVATLYFFTSIFFEGMFSNANRNNSDGMALFLNSNLGIFIGLGIFLFLIVMLACLINYTYPIAYLKLVAEKKTITTESIIAIMKEKAGRTIIFFLASLVVMIPLIFILMGIMFLLTIIIIGIPLLLIVGPALMSWMILCYYDYITTENGYFQSLGNGFNLLKMKFWPIIGSTVIMYIIVQMIVGIFSFVPYIITIAGFMASIDTESQSAEPYSAIMIAMNILMIVYTISSFTLQNLIFVNQGVIYYSVKDEEENYSIKSDIDLIGQNEE
ncbi:hypothetical protein [Flavobacterium sp.]|uniref:hypothetical protein n=1 Tax=Flavobacterium sp. TaxID=239 RepID=UPI004048267E